VPPSDPPRDDAPASPRRGGHRGPVDPNELSAFAPRIRWRFWGPMLFLLVLFPTLWWVKRTREANARRARLLQEHATLTAGLSRDYVRRRDALETLVVEAVGPYPGDLRAEGFSLEALTREPVLYARVRAHEVNARDTVLASVRHRYPDQFPSCLGLETVLAREVMDKGAFLHPSYVDAIRGASDTERLAALRDDLLFRLRRDSALLVEGLRRPYLVLAVDEARVSVDGPTRVFVHDVSAGRTVLRARGAGTDMLVVPFRIAGIPSAAPRAGAGLPRMGLSQHDCSIANTVRAALGVEPLGLMHAPPTAPLDAGSDASSAPDASSVDAPAAQPVR
jgi:hypothetical protein